MNDFCSVTRLPWNMKHSIINGRSLISIIYRYNILFAMPRNELQKKDGRFKFHENVTQKLMICLWKEQKEQKEQREKVSVLFLS